MSGIDRNYGTHQIRKPKSVKTSFDTERHCILLAAIETGKERQDRQADRQDRQSVRPRENTRHDNDDGHREETVRVDMTDRQIETERTDTKRSQSRHERQTDRYREKRQTEQTW